jgi:hypothetical protein
LPLRGPGVESEDLADLGEPVSHGLFTGCAAGDTGAALVIQVTD